MHINKIVCRALAGKPDKGQTRAMRRQNMATFNRHRNLEKAATFHDAKRGWLPSFKATLIEVKPILPKGK